eukprot:scaffold69408_cov21-Tisochrysis_lutea.AAC.2
MQQACSPGAPPAAHGAGDTCRGSYEHTAAHPPDLSCTPCMISRLPPDSWNQAESTEGDRVWRPEGTLRSFISFLQSEIKQRGIPKRQLNFNLKSRCSHIATCKEINLDLCCSLALPPISMHTHTHTHTHTPYEVCDGDAFEAMSGRILPQKRSARHLTRGLVHNLTQHA